MKNKILGMVMGSFMGDAFSLAPHWIYNAEQIKNTFGRLDNIADLPEFTYHKTKHKGDFTHYGDQALWLLEYLKENGKFDIHEFKAKWVSEMSKYNGYIDHSSKETLELIKDNEKIEGSNSSDMAGASMIAPLIYYYYTNKQQMNEAVENRIKLTHHNALVVDSGKFMANVIVNVLNGMAPVHSMTFELERSGYLSQQSKLFIEKGIEKAKAYIEYEAEEAIKLLGQSCSILHAFPSTVYLVMKYENDFKNALIANAMAGGDSAARGMMLGMVLGAYHKLEEVPVKWLHDMNSYSEILRLLS
ncbi:MAG: ADP-ribosylglycohydrolase family protein [Clostridia bacterium]|nr:ADP-ribosylglycohydrolase family protein [Clostridia bacterium]